MEGDKCLFMEALDATARYNVSSTAKQCSTSELYDLLMFRKKSLG